MPVNCLIIIVVLCAVLIFCIRTSMNTIHRLSKKIKKLEDALIENKKNKELENEQ